MNRVLNAAKSAGLYLHSVNQNETDLKTGLRWWHLLGFWPTPHPNCHGVPLVNGGSGPVQRGEQKRDLTRVLGPVKGFGFIKYSILNIRLRIVVLWFRVIVSIAGSLEVPPQLGGPVACLNPIVRLQTRFKQKK